MSKPYNKPCEICGSMNQILLEDEDRISIFCNDCNNFDDLYVSEELQKYWDEQDKKEAEEYLASYPTVKCTYCCSPNTKKITVGSKAVHTALFGVFSMSRNSKQWHCNNCKADF